MADPRPPTDPARLQVTRHALDGVAEQMGVALERSAYSPNITERLDLSAAIFSPSGEMVAQAEHIPVHLGSMPASVDSILGAFDLSPGMTAVVNDPYRGGSHLPDITLVGAVGDREDGRSGRLIGYVANRAHHADIAGAAPGSMPADATDIAMEGLRIPPLLLVDDHGERTDVIEMLAANSRTPTERHGDLRAQFAANHAGAARLCEMAAERGRDGLLADMDALVDYAERRIRAALAEMPDGEWTFSDWLEVAADGSMDAAAQAVGLELHTTVAIRGDQLVVDLTRCPPQVPANVNAVRAVTESAALFVLRLVTDPDAPANAGTARHGRRPHGHDQHAQHPGRGAGGGLPAAGRSLRAPQRYRRRGAARRGRRDRARDRGADRRTGDGADRTPGPGAMGPGRRSGRTTGAQHPHPTRRDDAGPPREGDPDGAGW